MFVVVSYDIVCDRRRGRLAKRLVEHLNRVQKSVFEGSLTEAGYTRMLADVQANIEPREDNVRVYHLCRGCSGSTELYGISPTWPAPDEDEVV